MVAPNEFRSLAQLVRGTERVLDEPAAPAHVEETIVQPPVTPLTDVEALLRDVRLFRAHVAEAVDACVERLTSEIAQHVLARELELAPADIDAIVDGCLASLNDARDIRVFVHLDDAARVTVTPVESDPSLERGDCVVRLESGSVRSTLQLRLHGAIVAGLE